MNANEYQMRVGVVKVEICVVRFGEKKPGSSAPPACHNQRVKLYAFDLLSAKHLCLGDAGSDLRQSWAMP